jgi:hypothetical protein
MSAQILPFPTVSTALASPIALHIRLGAAHQKLAALLAASRFPATRMVVEASRFARQVELVHAMQDAGAAIVLDPETAELAAPAKFAGNARHAPWALPSVNGLLGPEHFSRHAPRDVIGQIARFAVQSRCDVVLSPTHFLGDPNYDQWLAIDHEACGFLREALDREGGSNIAIDYSVIISHTELNNPNVRGMLTAAVADLPIDNVWIRASGLDSNSGPLTVRRYLTALSSLHNLGKPLIADYLGGLVGTAALAFGVVSGVAHGINERERFDAADWHKPPTKVAEDKRFGPATRIAIPGLNRSFKVGELELLSKARGGRRLVSCSDPNCCPRGLPDMIAEPRRHAAHQVFRELGQLQGIPDLKREHHFLNGAMTIAERLAREIKNLKPPASEATQRGIDPTKLMARLSDHSRRTEQLHSALLELHDQRGDQIPRARSVQSRETKPETIRKDLP